MLFRSPRTADDHSSYTLIVVGKANRVPCSYPHFDDFIAVRDRLDPERRFANPYLERVLGR